MAEVMNAAAPGALADHVLERLFTGARTANRFSARPVPDRLLRELYDLVKFGPTASNLCPARFTFVRGHEAKERLLRALDPGNVERTREAPVTVIVGWAEDFHLRGPELFPGRPDLVAVHAGDERKEARREVAFRNSSLQGAYMIIAARALGLDCGPMSGFDPEVIERDFFPDRKTRVNFLCNLGFADRAAQFPRLPRLPFDEACALL
ncbi:malonic semialdehyde reductase [Actinomadura sp. 1N219]|uniref:malonic semialdehyde reductase n=1 Tax=Actinomadura sp. 1N219 TaxID=3375152 RepID=UPI0037AA12AC